MLFWKEHKDDTECQHCGRSKYMNVINEDGAYVTTNVAVKQLCYIPITPKLKRLLLCEETTQQIRWHKEGIRDSEDANIMSHPTDTVLVQNLQGTPGVFVLVYRRMVSNLTALIVLRTLTGQFL
jgi:hypothetical protein